MPLQNRVTPWGELVRSDARGTLMGNRGVLHNERKEIQWHFRGKRWIVCLLDFRGRRRKVMSPGHYTELFFLDEAVALAAGHRPCAECRRERFEAFREAWARAGQPHAGTRPSAPEMDAALHSARSRTVGIKVTHDADWNSLPDGCFIQVDGAYYLVSGDSLRIWSPAGYGEKVPRPSFGAATVVTPEPTVHCLRRGYRPKIHVSAREP